ncbi:MAG: Kae1-associated serine/threonine protein kinase [Candidatus Aenigmarchaeota archaeon]|nr:Kae1-associated serine/threonine protein kinase [Candidatus Aenigmarchaeota archaeon]
MQVLYQGAESKIYLDTFDGEQAIVKERIKKNYRITELDEMLRKRRTRKEIKLLTDVRKLNIQTPKILQVDESRCKIIMEYVQGDRLKEYINTNSVDRVKSVCMQLGKIIGKLHANDIVHGDLTTSNLILKDGKIYVIDLGMGEFTKRIEDKATDLKLLKQAIKSTHFKIFDLAWGSILSGYSEEYDNSSKVLEQMKEIEKRTRYTNRE